MSWPSSPVVLDSGSEIESECSLLSSPVKSCEGWSLSVSSLVLVCVYTRVVTCTASSRCIATGYARAKMNNGIEE